MKFTVLGPLPDLRKCSKAEVSGFFSWFLSIIPERLELLRGNVQKSYPSWDANYTPDSLIVLGEWFFNRIATRQRTSQEIDEVLSNTNYLIEIPAHELTDQTFADCFDIGIYLGEVFRRRDHKIKWVQVLGSKGNIYYGHPTISGFGKIDFSPVHLAVVLAYRIVEAKDDGKGLRELFDVWAKISSG